MGEDAPPVERVRRRPVPEATPLELVEVEPAGYCDPETGRCVTPEEPEEVSPEDDGTA